MADNVGTVAAIYEAFGRGDVPAILEHFADDIEWEQGARQTGVPYYAPRRGKQQVTEFFDALASNLELTHFEPEALCDGGEIVMVPVRHAGRVIGGGEVPMMQEAHEWRFGADGKVVSFRHLLDVAVHERAMAARSASHSGRTLAAVGEALHVLRAGGAFEVFELRGTADAGPPLHAHPWDEAYYGLTGTTEVTIGDHTTLLQAGDFALAPAGVLHTFRTLGDDAKTLLITDGGRASAFFADIDATVPPGVPTPETLPVLIEVAMRNGLSSPLFS